LKLGKRLCFGVLNTVVVEESSVDEATGKWIIDSVFRDGSEDGFGDGMCERGRLKEVFEMQEERVNRCNNAEKEVTQKGGSEFNFVLSSFLSWNRRLHISARQP
jgi:hypothetical protein